MAIAEAQNELAKLQIDILNTEAHNARLTEALKLLTEELDDKGRTIERYEVEMKRRMDTIEKKTLEIDVLNRKYEKMLSGQTPRVETGPLEATIQNLQREIDHKGYENRELQRTWISQQAELVTLQVRIGERVWRAPCARACR